jgi:septum formation protein
MKKIILASASPRRKTILKQIGLEFDVAVGNHIEKIDFRLKPHQLAQELSFSKAKSVAGNCKNAIIIAADTLVVIDKEIIGKPKDARDAKRILKRLSGKCHQIITGFTIIDTLTGKKVTKSVETKVYFKILTDEEIDSYIKTGEPLDKGGAYGIQEKRSLFIEKIEGDYFNVVGLPIFALAQELQNFGISGLF